MQKLEFEKMANVVVTDKQYKKIEWVYMNHPALEVDNPKEVILEIYQKFGMTVIEDMYQRVLISTIEKYEMQHAEMLQQQQDLTKRLREKENDINSLKLEKGSYGVPF